MDYQTEMGFMEGHGWLKFVNLGLTCDYRTTTGLVTMGRRPGPVELTLEAYERCLGELSMWRQDCTRRYAPSTGSLPLHTQSWELLEGSSATMLVRLTAGGRWSGTYVHVANHAGRKIVLDERPQLELNWAGMALFAETHASLLQMALRGH